MIVDARVDVDICSRLRSMCSGYICRLMWCFSFFTVQELSETKQAYECRAAELDKVKAESHKRKKIIATQQLVMQNGKEAYNKVVLLSDKLFCVSVPIEDNTIYSSIMTSANASL